MAHSRLGLAEAWGNLKSLRFNQDKTTFCCAFQDRLRMFNLELIRERAHYTEDQAEMLYRTNLAGWWLVVRNPSLPIILL